MKKSHLVGDLVAYELTEAETPPAPSQSGQERSRVVV